MLRNGSDIDWRDDQGSPALHWAVSQGHLNLVQNLVEQGAAIDSRDIYQNTPLHWATPFPAVADYLLKSGAKVNAQNNTGQSAFMWSAQDGQVEILRRFLQSDAERHGSVKVKVQYLADPATLLLKTIVGLATFLRLRSSFPSTFPSLYGCRTHAVIRSS